MKHRLEIDGLRALAVIVVVLSHLGLSGFAGGFVGVDVFFVISGYLITGLLLADYAKNSLVGVGWISLRTFYWRRAKRILPMALVVILATIAVGWYYLNEVKATQITQDGLWAAFFLANVHLIQQSTDYFQHGFGNSVFQHFWSLSVEEQFYVVFPALVIAFAWLARKLRRADSWIGFVTVGIIAVTFGSLGFSVWQTSTSATVAYFSSFTRAYELGIGAILAVLTFGERRERSTAWMTSSKAAEYGRLVLSTAAIGVIAFCTASMNGGSKFPGAIALVPTLATALFIYSESGPGLTLLGKFFATRPVVFVGKISYAIYLIHWPVILLLPLIWSDAETRWMSIPIAFGATMLLSVLGHYLIEKPARNLPVPASFNQRLTKRRAISISALAATSVLVASIAFASGNALIAPSNQQEPGSIGDGPFPSASSVLPQPNESSSSAAPSPDTKPTKSPTQSEKPSTEPSSTSKPSATPTRTVTPSATPTPTQEPTLSQLLSAWKPKVIEGTLLDGVPSGLNPKIGQLLSQRGTQWAACMDPKYHQVTCSYGPSDAKHTAVILGDSYALAVYPMVIYALGLTDWRVIGLNKRECMVSDITPWSWSDAGADAKCPDHRAWTLSYLKNLQPDLVVLSDQPFHPIADGDKKAVDNHDDLWYAGLDSSLSTISKLKSSVVYFGIPSNAGALTDCVGAGNILTDACFGKDNQWPQYLGAQKALSKKYGISFIDPTDWMCAPSHICPPIIDNTPVFWDGAHLTQDFAAKLAPLFRAYLIQQGLIAK